MSVQTQDRQVRRYVAPTVELVTHQHCYCDLCEHEVSRVVYLEEYGAQESDEFSSLRVCRNCIKRALNKFDKDDREAGTEVDEDQPEM